MNSRTKSRVLLANLIAQTGIVITGAIVRLTSSGLGCPSWPECVPGSVTPTSSQTQAWHKYIEFGNRTLTSVLVVVALLTIFAMRKESRELRRLSYGTLLGIFGQALLGGVTVLTGLNPIAVGSHFLLSIWLISVAYKLKYLYVNPNQPVTVQPVLINAVRFHSLLAVIVLVIGTLVTGSGPHAGDSADIARLPFDPRMISWLHADVVLLFVGLSIGLAIAFKATHAPERITKAAIVVVVVSLAQGLIGYVQYFTALPWVLVAFHVLGACLLWIATLNLRFNVRTDQYRLPRKAATSN